jgi:serine/threonine protein kinase
MEPGQILCNKFQITKRIGAGSFGVVYSAVNLDNGTSVGLKVETVGSSRLQLMNEARVLKNLQGAAGFAHLYSATTEGTYNVLAMELLGPSLESLLRRCSRRLSLKSVLQVTLQMLDRIEHMHRKSYIHRDIKPDNFCMGTGEHEGILYIIDFGLSKRFQDAKTKQHLLYRENKSLTGTARYASLNSHQGMEVSRRDDLESAAYVLFYLLKGALPWQGVKAASKIEKYNRIAEKKVRNTPEVLCIDIPAEFGEMLRYSRSLGFEAKPDYSYLKKLFLNLATKINITLDAEFDWPHNSLQSLQAVRKVTSTSVTSRKAVGSVLEPPVKVASDHELASRKRQRRVKEHNSSKRTKSSCISGCALF